MSDLGLHYPETRRRRRPSLPQCVVRFVQGLGVASMFWVVLLIWLRATAP